MSFVAIFDTVGTFSPTSYTTTDLCPELCLAYVAYSTSIGSAFIDPGTRWQIDFDSYQTWTMTSALINGGVGRVCLPIAATQAFLNTQAPQGHATTLGNVDTLSIITSQISGIATAQNLASCGSLQGTVMVRRSLLGSQISSINFYTDPASTSGASTSTSVTIQSSTASVTTQPSEASTSSAAPATVTVVSGPSDTSAPQATGISTGAKVGIGIGVSVAVLTILGVLMFALRYRRKHLTARKADAGEPARRELDSTAAGWRKPELQGQPRSELQGASGLSELPTSDRLELDATNNTEKLDIKELPAEEVANEVSTEVTGPRK